MIAKLFKFILLLPFKIIFFPFKMIRNMFSTRQQREYRRMKGSLSGNIDKMKGKLNDEKLSEKDRKTLSNNIEKTEGNLGNLRKWRRSSRRLESDPDNMNQFRRAKRFEKRLRKDGGNVR